MNHSFRCISSLRTLGLAAVVAIAIGLGCKRDEISVYDVPKETAPKASLPAGWEELPGDQMRIGNYVVHGKGDEKAQVTVIALPGEAGGETDNVNRWRGQVGLAPQTAEEVKAAGADITIGGEPARFFEMTGSGDKSGTRMLAAWQNHGESKWFFKMIGPDSLVREQKNAFLEFCKGYRYSDSAPQPPAVAQSASSEAASQSATPTEQHWNAPPDWKSETPGPMQDAKFSAADGKAVVTVSILQGTAGGLLPNINRWRGQIELPPISDAELASTVTNLDLPEPGAKLADMTGPKQRMVAAIVPREEKTWFFKLLGEPASVGAEKDKFIGFVKSAK